MNEKQTNGKGMLTKENKSDNITIGKIALKGKKH